MNLLTKSLAVFALSILASFALVAVTPSIATAQEDNQEQQAEQDESENNSEENAVPGADSEEVYNYNASQGDSYSLIARKAIQSYGQNFEVEISEAEIIAAETWLTQDAGSPLLNVGQEVLINVSDMADAVDRAKNLSEETKDLWAQYAAFADFNTEEVARPV